MVGILLYEETFNLFINFIRPWAPSNAPHFHRLGPSRFRLEQNVIKRNLHQRYFAIILPRYGIYMFFNPSATMDLVSISTRKWSAFATKNVVGQYCQFTGFGVGTMKHAADLPTGIFSSFLFIQR